MEVRIIEDRSCSGIEVVLRCQRLDQRVADIVARLRVADLKLTGYVNGEASVVPASDVLYIESLEGRTLFYTAQESYETRLRLYEMERLLDDADFVRASKSCLVNFSEVASIKPDRSGRLLITLSSGDRVQVSRQYAVEIKRKLGM